MEQRTDPRYHAGQVLDEGGVLDRSPHPYPWFEGGRSRLTAVLDVPGLEARNEV